MISVQNPCSQTWAALEGDERKRFCGECGKFVYAVTAYPEAELGGKCIYVERNTTAPPQSRRAVMAGALLTTIAPLLAAEGRVRVVVMAGRDSRLAGAVVRVGMQRATTNSEGEASFAGLPVGSYVIEVTASGFGTFSGTYNVTNESEVRVYARVDVGTVGGGPGLEVHEVKNSAALTGALRISILDESNAVIPGATVAVSRMDGEAKTVHSDESGIASFSNLALGDYAVSVTKPGFKTWRGNGIATSGDPSVLQVKLTVADIANYTEVRQKSPARRFIDWLTTCTRR